MATSGIYKGTRVVGDYIFGKQIGQGSFSVVWHARHRIRGTEVAVKEIAMERLSKKLQDSLLSEIVILKKIVHPNIIALYDIIEVPGRIFLILEYCRGGDLSMYIQRHGSVPEETAKHFMQQLAAGLQVLRENNLIHRDLKPQNLLLTTFDDDSVLKIADFGFARSLQPRGLAETLCGSPLYMAPEIMQLQKYDAKADLWSVGAILYQLVTGKTPFTGSNQIQLLQNIIKSTDLRFPHANILSSECIDLCQRLLRRNPVERLTFEEFFNHQFLAQLQLEESLSRTSSDMRDPFPSIESSPARLFGASSQEDCLPFVLDDESNGQDGYPSLIKNNRFSAKPTYGFFVDDKVETNNISISSKNVGVSRFSSSPNTPDITAYGRNSHISTNRDVKETSAPKKDLGITDSLEFIDQEYVIVPVLPLDTSSSSISAEEPHSSPGNFECSTMKSLISNPSSAPVPILGEAVHDIPHIGSIKTFGISPGSADITKQRSSNCMMRIRSLQQCASVVSELVKDEVANERLLEAFSIQLVLLSLWKQALYICHSHVTSAVESSSNDSYVSDAVCLQIEQEFLLEVEHAEELAKDLGQVGETIEMPDAIELIFQYALTFGRHGAVDEMMENAERAATRYSKSMCLLHFLLVEASSLLLTPPITLTDSDRVRLRSYMNVISSRHVQSMSQRIALLKSDGA